jgi:hypothetical protein
MVLVGMKILVVIWISQRRIVFIAHIIYIGITLITEGYSRRTNNYIYLRVLEWYRVIILGRV